MNKRPLNLAIAVALILLSVSMVEANEQQGDVTNNVSLEDLRKLIFNEISQAKNRGVGTKPYEDAISVIDTDFNRGENPDKIHQCYDPILKNLKNQNREATLLRSGKHGRVLTTNERDWGEEFGRFRGCQQHFRIIREVIFRV